MNVCKRVVYTGRVQGVGFRYTAQGLARGFPISGTVRNCPDGSVELTVQGEAEQVQAFLAALERQMEGYITGQVTTDAAPPTVQGFHIIR